MPWMACLDHSHGRNSCGFVRRTKHCTELRAICERVTLGNGTSVGTPSPLLYVPFYQTSLRLVRRITHNFNVAIDVGNDGVRNGRFRPTRRGQIFCIVPLSAPVFAVSANSVDTVIDCEFVQSSPFKSP